MTDKELQGIKDRLLTMPVGSGREETKNNDIRALIAEVERLKIIVAAKPIGQRKEFGLAYPSGRRVKPFDPGRTF